MLTDFNSPFVFFSTSSFIYQEVNNGEFVI